ncbi:alpha/beta hydrolase [Mongoliibacter ruber]|uniref:Phospholipase/carboxylesterase n=1 Tax=Mongoliibacter ruber TaxID=1750599 RepID=A0A2T0WIU4_9BACT|nr:dienelactone hydrolase family protein [Mongoliibacter ruber]PRY86628.1 phospholipase/carboxylesterase [Mongoliibacter ruber]
MSNIINAGLALNEAKKVAIMIHGRGGTAKSILSLEQSLNLEDFALIAPQAPGNTWYPYSFMAPDKNNEPSFSNSIEAIDGVIQDLKAKGFSTEQIFILGFSQGACLSLEYAAQNAAKYGGVVAFTGGLIGEHVKEEKYKGDFGGTPVFIGSGFKDPHVPLSRIKQSQELLSRMGATVKTFIFEDFEHTIRQEEVDWVNEHILK